MTSIEWLIKKIESFGISTDFLNETVRQAKERHKQELFEYWQGGINCTEVGGKSFDQYYKELHENNLVEISDEEIIEAGDRLVDDEYEFNAFIIGAKWYREQLKQSNCQEILDSSKRRAANYMNLKRK
jgi:hypothetical protein